MRSTLPRAKRLEQLDCDRLGQRHRWEPPCEYLAVHTENPADGATTNGGSPTTRNPTTPGDSHVGSARLSSDIRKARVRWCRNAIEAADGQHCAFDGRYECMHTQPDALTPRTISGDNRTHP